MDSARTPAYMAKRSMMLRGYPASCIPNDPTVTAGIYSCMQHAHRMNKEIKELDATITMSLASLANAVSPTYYTEITDKYAAFLASDAASDDFKNFINATLEDALKYKRAPIAHGATVQRTMFCMLVDHMQCTLLEYRAYRASAPNHVGLQAILEIETASPGVQRILQSNESLRKQLVTSTKRLNTVVEDTRKLKRNWEAQKKVFIQQGNEHDERIWKQHKNNVAAFQKMADKRVKEAEDRGMQIATSRNLIAATNALRQQHQNEIARMKQDMQEQFDRRLADEKKKMQPPPMRHKKRTLEAETRYDELPPKKRTASASLGSRSASAPRSISKVIRKHLIEYHRFDPSNAMQHIKSGRLPTREMKSYANGRTLRQILTGKTAGNAAPITTVTEYWELLFDSKTFEGPVTHAFHLLYNMQARRRNVSLSEWQNYITREITQSGQVLRTSCKKVARLYMQENNMPLWKYPQHPNKGEIACFVEWIDNTPDLAQQVQALISLTMLKTPSRRKSSCEADAKIAQAAKDERV